MEGAVCMGAVSHGDRGSSRRLLAALVVAVAPLLAQILHVEVGVAQVGTVMKDNY